MIFSFIFAASLLLFAAIFIYLFFKTREKSKRQIVSEQGYETAYDILFSKRKRKKHRVA